MKPVTGQKRTYLQPELGLEYGMLKVVEEAGRNARGQKLWKNSCRCEGLGGGPGWIVVGDNNVRQGMPRSCGCLLSPAQRAAIEARRGKPREPREQPRKQPKPKGKLPVENRLPYRPQTVQRPPAAPAQRATGNVTYGPSYTHDPRFQFPEGHVVHGEFSRLGPGRYLDGGL
jgi:hypothetical protein